MRWRTSHLCLVANVGGVPHHLQSLHDPPGAFEPVGKAHLPTTGFAQIASRLDTVVAGDVDHTRTLRRTTRQAVEEFRLVVRLQFAHRQIEVEAGTAAPAFGDIGAQMPLDPGPHRHCLFPIARVDRAQLLVDVVVQQIASHLLHERAAR